MITLFIQTSSGINKSDQIFKIFGTSGAFLNYKFIIIGHFIVYYTSLPL